MSGTHAARAVLRFPFSDETVVVSGPAADGSVVRLVDREHGVFHHELMLVIQRFVPLDGVVLDIGANVGVLTLAASRLVPGGRVVAIEPLSALFEHLEANTAGCENVERHRLAVGDRDGDLTINYDPAYLAGATASEAPELAGHDTVDCVTLDRWFEGGRADLVKIDVEGFEVAVLRGARRTLRRLRPHAVVEAHPVMLRRCGAGIVELHRELRRAFPRLFVIEADGTLRRIASAGHLEHVLIDRGACDLFASRRSRGRPLGLRSLAAALADWRRLRSQHQRPPTTKEHYVVAPAHTVRIDMPPFVAAGEPFDIPVSIENRGKAWLTGRPSLSPVYLAATWLTEPRLEHRQLLDVDIAPRSTRTVSVRVHAPPAPGPARLRVTTVQERYTWHDIVCPTAATEVDVSVG